MRIHLKTNKNNCPVPFNYHESIVGAFHKWAGNNHFHDRLSLYSISWLEGGTSQKGKLNFAYGAHWFISAHDTTLIKKVIQGIHMDPTINYGMVVEEITLQETPSFDYFTKFKLASPVFIKRTLGNRIKYYFHNDEVASALLTETLKNKLRKGGISDQNVNVNFDLTDGTATTKMTSYKGIKCKASLCPVAISGSPEQIGFAWDVGIGNSSGIGFGALK